MALGWYKRKASAGNIKSLPLSVFQGMTFRLFVAENESYNLFFLSFQNGAPVKAWVKGVPVEKDATDQLLSLAKLPIIHSHVAAMPDMHLGKGACVGCVVATVNAIIPSAVGVVGGDNLYPRILL